MPDEKMLIPARAIRAANLDARDLEKEYLRQHGWQETCQTPGNYWLWEKKLEDGRVVLCNESTAFSMQEALTPDPEEDECDDG